MNACKKAKPEPLKEPIYTETFKAAFSATKATYGFFGICFTTGTESDMLEHLTHQILCREIIDDLIVERAKAQPAHAKEITLSVHRHVQKIVRPIVHRSWDHCLSNAKVLKPTVELAVKYSLQSLLPKEVEIKAHIEGNIREIVLPYLPEIEHIFCRPILQRCWEPILQAYEVSMETLHTELLSLINNVDLHVDSIRRAQRSLEVALDQESSASNSILSPAQKILWAMHTEELIDLQDIFEVSGVEGFDIYSDTLDDMKVLVQNAVYTFGMTALLSLAINDANSRSSSRAGGAGINVGSGDGSLAALAKETKATVFNNSTSGAANIMSVPIGVSGTGDQSDGNHNISDHNSDTSGGGKSDRSNSPSPTREGYGESGGTRSPGKSDKERSRSRSGRSKSRSGASSSSSSSGRHAAVPKIGLLKALNQIIVRTASDALLSMRSSLLRLVLDTVEAKVQESMLIPSAHEAKSARSLVTKDYKALIHLPSLAEGMVRDLVKEYVLTVMEQKMMAAHQRLQAMSDRLCSANPTVPDAMGH
jgi:hypothetical protein